MQCRPGSAIGIARVFINADIAAYRDFVPGIDGLRLGDGAVALQQDQHLSQAGILGCLDLELATELDGFGTSVCLVQVR